MWWILGGVGVVLYIVLIVSLGMMTLRKGHVALFVVGIFLPVLWLLGAILPPRTRSA